MDTFVIVLSGLVGLADKTPAADDVKAGWSAFWIFVGLALAVAFLGWSLTRHLKKTERNAEKGVFGEDESHKHA